MTLITRISRLFKADIHGLLDSIEEPQTLLKQAVREMQEAIDVSDRERKRITKRIEQHSTYHDQTSQTASDLENKIDLCFQQNNLDLARSFIRKKLETTERLGCIESELSSFKQQQQEVILQIANRKEKLAAVMDKMNVLSDATLTNSVSPFDVNATHDSVSDDDVEIAYMAEKQRRSQT